MKKVAVLMGGWSEEREISLRSGQACLEALEKSPREVVAVDVDHSIAKTLEALKPDVALNMLHGPYGEDGCIQGVLEILQIPYSHSGVLASSLAMNKARAREVYKSSGVPTAEGCVVPRSDLAAHPPLAFPFVIKPIANGSSVGVFIVRNESELPKGELLSNTWKFGEEVLVEQYIEGKELTCAVMGDRALDVIEIISDRDFYNFDAKYAPGGSQHILPAPLEPSIYQKVQAYALAAHQALGCRGISRSDFRYDGKSGQLVCLETNTQPGMTRTSLVPELAAKAGYTFSALVEWMIADASLHR